MQWYEDIAKRYPNWQVVDKYIDEGITGMQKEEALLAFEEKGIKFDSDDKKLIEKIEVRRKV